VDNGIMMGGLEKLKEIISTHSLLNPPFYETWSCEEVLEE
jgi:hypothetical protein